MTVTMRRCAISAALVALWPMVAYAGEEPCRDLTYDGIPYTLCEVGAEADLRLFLRDARGDILGTFSGVDAHLAARDQRLAFATNAGMYHPDRRPVGLYVEDGEEQAGLVTREGPGNFALLPNGVFCIGDGRFAVIESRQFQAVGPDCRFATQSGPMLVIDGALHPRFLPDSDSVYVRNGVGVNAVGDRAYVVISNQPVTFHQFARVFRDALGTPQALFLDGNISRLHAPGLGRSDWGLPMGPILGLVVPVQDGA
jgi:uncharacterized protein YigE (DUF2233 family)